MTITWQVMMNSSYALTVWQAAERKVVNQCGYQTCIHRDAVHQKLSGMKFLQNVRASSHVAEELLRRIITWQVMMWQAAEGQSCGSM